MMMTKRSLILALLIMCAANASAQFTLQGRIEYERRSNLHKLWEGDQWLESFKDKIKPFYSVYFNLAFTESGSRYSPGREVDAPKMTWGLPPFSDNDVHQDYTQHRVTAFRNLYEEPFLIRDSAARRQWRIGSEIRTIAGYQCRKAVTRICDSVYVVAFYTDEIPVSGGPEEMGGLPGMILELAVPRLFTTWTATKVDVVSIKPDELTPPTKKGKSMNHDAFEALIRKSLQDWGRTGVRNVWRSRI